MAQGLKHLKNHIKTVANIKKVTGSMKMVAAARFIQADKLLAVARPIGQGVKRFYERAVAEAIAGEKLHYVVPVTSDKGLCGSCHIRVCKRAKQFLLQNSTVSYRFFCIGEKSRSIIAFEYPEHIVSVVNGVGHKVPTFRGACVITLKLLTREHFHRGSIIFPLFKNMMAFEVIVLPMYSWNVVASSKGIIKYEIDSDEDFRSYMEFVTAALVYYALCEAHLVELSARINAMSGASKNAAKLQKQLALQYNRMRQAHVTKELMDIIGGASVITKKKK